MTAPDFPAEFLAALDRAVEARDGTPERGEIRFRCPAPDHPDEHPSARWNRKKAVWCCDTCGASGGALNLADLLGVELLIIDGSTNRRDFADRIRWNQAYYRLAQGF